MKAGQNISDEQEKKFSFGVRESMESNDKKQTLA